MSNGTQQVYPGDAKYEDINGDGVIDANDIVYLGNYSPKILGGFNFRLSYKNWQLSANFQGRVGQKVFNQTLVSTPSRCVATATKVPPLCVVGVTRAILPICPVHFMAAVTTLWVPTVTSKMLRSCV